MSLKSSNRAGDFSLPRRGENRQLEEDTAKKEKEFRETIKAEGLITDTYPLQQPTAPTSIYLFSILQPLDYHMINRLYQSPPVRPSHSIRHTNKHQDARAISVTPIKSKVRAREGGFWHREVDEADDTVREDTANNDEGASTWEDITLASQRSLFNAKRIPI